MERTYASKITRDNRLLLEGAVGNLGYRKFSFDKFR
jgi:hypothetical protein